MSATLQEDPSQWGDEEILREALLILSKEDPGIAEALSRGIEARGSCDCCGALIVDVFTEEASRALAEGSRNHARLSSLVEKPVEINFDCGQR